MSDLAAVVLAVAAALGSWVAAPVPLLLGPLVAAAGLGWRRPLVLCVGAALATSALAARSWAGLHPPASGRWSGTVTLVGDPGEVSGATRVLVRLRGKRVEAWARGRPAWALHDRLAGERVVLTGRLQPLPSTIRRRLAPAHVSARMTVAEVGARRGGDPASRLANGVRRTLLEGTSAMSKERQSLFAGFVLGDDRNQPPEVTDDFRSSGLTHLLVVSGENVAFVLAVAAPVLTRLRLRWRLVAGLALLGFFGMLVRWEPSVLRAEAMATLALLASTLGRPASTIRLLALAVTGLLLVDPLLVLSVGFLLSIGASAGIAVLAPPLARAIPGPRPLASALAVTLAAQVGVAPVLVGAFGGIPLATVPANLLAIPAAGPLTMWGMTAGVPAGLTGPPVATVLHVPTDLLVGWVAAVARRAAALPLGQLGGRELVALVAAGAVACHWRTRHPMAAGAAATAAVVAVVAMGASSAAVGEPLDGRPVGPGGRLWRRSGATVLVVDDVRSATGLLRDLHRAGVRRLDAVVVVHASRAAARVVEPVFRRLHPRLLLAPGGSPLGGAQVPPAATRLTVGPLAVDVVGTSPSLRVEVTDGSGRPPPGEARGPPALGSQPCGWPWVPGPTTCRPGPSSWASSTARPTRSSTPAPTSPWTPSAGGPRSWSTRAPTSSTWAG